MYPVLGGRSGIILCAKVGAFQQAWRSILGQQPYQPLLGLKQPLGLLNLAPSISFHQFHLLCIPSILGFALIQCSPLLLLVQYLEQNCVCTLYKTPGDFCKSMDIQMSVQSYGAEGMQPTDRGRTISIHLPQLSSSPGMH